MRNILCFVMIRCVARRSGQTALSLVMAIGTIIAIVGVTLAFLVFSFLNSSAGFQAAERANAAATAGAEDALLRLVRDKSFAYADPGYAFSVDGVTTTVVVVQNVSQNRATITAQATASLRRRVLEVVVSIASTTGHVSVVSWKQI